MATECMQGADECKYVVLTTVEVIDSDSGEVKDVKKHEMRWKMTYAGAMAVGYLQMKKFVESGIESFLKVMAADGDAEKALKND